MRRNTPPEPVIAQYYPMFDADKTVLDKELRVHEVRFAKRTHKDSRHSLGLGTVRQLLKKCKDSCFPYMPQEGED